LTTFGQKVQDPPLDSLCPLCEKALTNCQLANVDTIWIECARCGRYSMDPLAEFALRHDPAVMPKRFILSAATCQAANSGLPLHLEAGEVQALIAAGVPPRNQAEAVDRLLLVLNRRSTNYRGQTEWINATDYPLLTIENERDANWVMRALMK
jgi:hypothetical protein